MFVLAANCNDATFAAVLLFMKKLVQIICIIAPILLILLLTVDFTIGVVARDDSKLAKVKSIAIRRIIFAIILLFVPTIITTVMSFLGDKSVEFAECYDKVTDSYVDKLTEQLNEEITTKEKKELKEMQEKQKQIEDAKKEREKNAKKAMEKAKSSNNSSNATTNTGATFRGKAKRNKTYSGYHKLGEISDSDFQSKITTSSTSSAKIAQSFAVVGNYYVIAANNSSDSKSYITVWDKRTNKLVNSYSTSLGHANGMAYNRNDNKIYVAHSRGSTVYKFSANNIESRRSLNVSKTSASVGVSGVAFDSVTNKLYYTSGYNIYEIKKNGSAKKVIHKVTWTRGLSQDIGAYDGIVYVIRINKLSNKNFLDLYKASNGGYLGSYVIKDSNEIQSIDYYGEGNKMAILFNKWGSKDNFIKIIDTTDPS